MSFDDVDFFTDPSVHTDPYPYLELLRRRGPVWREPHHAVVVVTGYDEAVEVYRDTASFSSCNSASGPFPGFPVPLEAGDVTALIDQHRHELPLSDLFITFDPPKHAHHRGLLMRLLTPKRLEENEEFMWGLADRQIDEFVARGRCELIKEYAQPFSLLVIADLLGVPEADHGLFRRKMADFTFGALGGETASTNAAEFLGEWFTTYVEDRRREPRDDVITSLASAKFPDGSTPDVADVVRIACFLFAAGQETTARLIGFALRLIAERPELQRLLRDNRGRIPDFVEETLRMESPVKSDFRLARVDTTIGGVDIPAGSTVMIVPGAVNRDPRRFEAPHELRVDRRNLREHLTFGRGIHSCPGGPLARVEARITIERILDRMADITISESEHGPTGARRYEYEPSYILHGLEALHLEFTPIG